MSNDWGNGITRITLTDGKQRASRRVGISYDYMDKLNTYVKAGIFVDKDKNGFTKSEQKALGAEFEKLHTERGDKTNFKKMIAGKSFDYKNEEFIRLAKAAGYILAEDVKPEKNTKPAEEVKPAENAPVKKVEETKPAEPVVKTDKKEEVKQETKPQETQTAAVETDEISSLAKELEEMKKNWTPEQLKNPQQTIRNMAFKLQNEITELNNDYTIESVTTRKFLRKAKTELVKVPKSQEQIETDKLKAKEKYAQLDKLAKLAAIETLYSSLRPTKYAGTRGDMFLEGIVTTEDGRKLGAAKVKKQVYDELYGREVDTWVTEYYPLSLRNYNEGKENEFPQYYYRVDKNAKPVEGEVKLAQYKIQK